MANRPLALTVNGILTGIRINVPTAPAPPRLILEGVLQDVDTGGTVKSFTEDVTDQLTPTQLAHVTAIVTRAQTWVDNHN